MVHECHKPKDFDVEHIPEIINPSNTFTKKMKYKTHFKNLRDSMMFSLQAFMNYSDNVPSHIISSENSSPTIPYDRNT